MNRRNHWSRLAITSALGVGLSYAFVFLAALPIRYMRLNFGRKTFLLSSLGSSAVLVSLGLWQWAFVYASICLLIGFYRELEEKHVSIFVASTIAVFLTAGANIFALLGYTQLKGIRPLELLTSKVQPFMAQVHQIPRFQETNVDNVLWYLPSGVVITMMLILFVSLTVNRVPVARNKQMELRMFRLPDWLVWAFIGGLAGSFIETQHAWIPIVSMNILAVTLSAYFFQGLAVANHFLDRLGIFGFWRMLAYFLIFFQLFVFVAGLGVLDFWFDFRTTSLFGPKNKRIKNI